MPDSNTVVGIDFSGSKRPGRSIWIAKGVANAPDDIAIESIEPAADAFDASGRDEILPSLREFITGLGDATVGIDFPFALPAECHEIVSWTDFLTYFHATFSNGSIDDYPGSFAADGAGRREIDYRYAGQSPLGPQIKYQVFYGLRDLLYPLIVEAEAATVSPMQEQVDGLPTVIEVYPAATFGRLCCYRTGYKDSPGASDRREANFECLAVEFGIEETYRETIVGSDDALDSLCAACSAGRASYNGLDREETNVEGLIYV